MLDAFDRIRLFGTSISIEPRASENILNVLGAQPCDFRDDEINIKQGEEAPARKENKSAPVVCPFKQGWHSEIHGIYKQPMESLAQRSSEGSKVVGP